MQVHRGRVQLAGAVAFQLHFFRYEFAGLRQQLHQTDGIGARNRVGIEFRLLPDEGRDQVGIQAVGRRRAFQVGPVGFREERFPIFPRQIRDVESKIIRRGTLHELDGLVVVSGFVVELRSLCRAPTATVGGRGGLQFAHGKIDQAAIAEKFGFLDV